MDLSFQILPGRPLATIFIELSYKIDLHPSHDMKQFLVLVCIYRNPLILILS
jgi:hypothetical protein